MNPMLNNFSNEELARHMEQFADHMPAYGRLIMIAEVPHLLRIAAQRLTEAEAETTRREAEELTNAQDEIVDNVRSQLKTLLSELVAIEDRISGFNEEMAEFIVSDNIGTEADPLRPEQ